MYADDAVLLAETPGDLQRSLDSLHIYANRRKLSLNTDKTKVMVFRRGGRLPRDTKFTYDNSNLEIVNNFAYLGIVFSYTGNFVKAQKTLASQGRKSMYKMQGMINKFVNLKPSAQLELFDKLVSPILLYGAEVWGFHTGSDIDVLHTQFCKRILHFIYLFIYFLFIHSSGI